VIQLHGRNGKVLVTPGILREPSVINIPAMLE
jgi:hypothetical protein